MILPTKLIEEIKSLALNINDEELASYICSILYEKRLLGEYIRLPKSKIVNEFSDKKYRLILSKLISSKLITRDFYEPLIKSYHYKISNRYTEFNNYNPKTPSIKRIMKKDTRKTENEIFKMPLYLKAMNTKIKSLSWEFSQLKTFSENYNPTENEYQLKLLKNRSNTTKEEYTKELRETMLISIANLENREFKFHRDNTSNRLHTNITNMKTILYGKVKEELKEIDIINSQPYFLSVLLKKLISKTNYTDNEGIEAYIGKHTPYMLANMYPNYVDVQSIITTKLPFSDSLPFLLSSHILSKEIATFEFLVVKGSFYEYFERAFGMNRGAVKILMFQILFSKNTSYRENKKIFIKEFPMINQVIEIIKEKEHNVLAILLQSIESFVMIDIICQRLVLNHSIIPITKHDSVAVHPLEVETTYNVMRGVFMELCGSVPKLKIKSI